MGSFEPVKTKIHMNILTESEIVRRVFLADRARKHNEAWRKHASFDRSGGGCANALQQAAIKAECGFDFTNEERGELELLDFKADPPVSYFAYPSDLYAHVTTFMGSSLGVITWLGQPWRSCFGDIRRNFRLRAINDHNYYGTIFGTYVRMRMRRR